MTKKDYIYKALNFVFGGFAKILFRRGPSWLPFQHVIVGIAIGRAPRKL